MKQINISENYSVTEDGRVFSHNVERFMKPQIDKQGYHMVLISLGRREKVKGQLIHRLVAQAYIPNPENKPQVNHKDGDKSNNHVDNLEWCTALENVRHAREVLGVDSSANAAKSMKGKFGKDHNRSKTVYQFNENKELIKEFGSLAEVQREIGVPFSTVSYACKNGNLTRKGFYFSFNESHFQIEPY